MFARISGPAFLWFSVLVFAASNSVVRLLSDLSAQHAIDGRNAISFCNLLFAGNACAGGRETRTTRGSRMTAGTDSRHVPTPGSRCQRAFHRVCDPIHKEDEPTFQRSRLNPLIALVLQGDERREWAPILLARVSLGLFFAISGGNKLFVPERHEGLIKTIIEAGIPFPEFTSVFLASVEFFGGILLVIGLLSTFCSIALTIAMILAIATVEIHTIPMELSTLDTLSWFLYLPQVMYVLIFVWLMVSGPGPVGLDSLLARRLGVARRLTADEVRGLSVY